MKILIVAYLLVQLLTFNSALKPSDICKIVKQNNCKRIYDSNNLKYGLDCGHISNKCEDRNHKYKCDKMYCSSDIKTCGQYKSKTRSVSSSLLKVFNQKIKDCSQQTQTRHVINKQDVCKNGQNCMLFEKAARKNSKVYSLYSIKDITCPCSNSKGGSKLNSQCGNDFCTVNSYVCDKLKAAVAANQTRTINFRDCFNGDQTIKNF